MKNKVLKAFFVFISIFAISSCSGGNGWNKIGTSKTINYCLLIGQIDHNDSSARTAGIREVLGTRDLEHKRLNPNTENPIPNENFYTDSRGITFRIVEIEHGEQKSMSGSTWDQQTANETATLWINKHYANSWIDLKGIEQNGQSISFFVSNNDGMAMGAIGSVRWMEGMPIFGYDANQDAVDAIKDGRITGTVDQSGTGQAAAIYMVARNLIDNPNMTKKEAVTVGFSEEKATEYGYIKSQFQDFNETSNAYLCKNVAVTKKNIEKFYNKTPSQKLAENEAIKSHEGGKGATIYHSYYSANDNFLNSTMKPLFSELATDFNFEVVQTFGNGNDEAQALDNLNTNLAKGKGEFSAFIINMVKTTSTKSYLDAIYNTYEEGGIVKEPIIFWNRQPTTETNQVDVESMNDKRFKNILYVGFDAIEGGLVQGQMIKDYIIDTIEGRKGMYV